MAVLTRFLRGGLAPVLSGRLWALFSLPVVTIVPATAALYAVMVTWNERGLPPVWSTFWSGFRRHLRQALWISVLLAAAWSIAILDLRYGLVAEGAPIRTPVMVAGLVGMFFLSGITVFLFPVMVRFPGPWQRVVRNAALFAAAYVFSTLLGLIVLGFGVLVFLATPWALPWVVSGAAFLLTRITGRCFDRYLLTHDVPATSAADPSDTNGSPADRSTANASTAGSEPDSTADSPSAATTSGSARRSDAGSLSSTDDTA